MYVELPAGSDGEPYIVPCELTGRTSGGQTQVLFTAPPPHGYQWRQWVRNKQLLTDEQVFEG